MSPRKKSSYSAQAGYPVRCGFSISSQASLEYWVARSSRAMTPESVACSWPINCSRIQFSNRQDTRGLIPSLRASGSRECAPDDRLREAIHVAAKLKSGLLRRFRLRSLSYGGQVAPRNDVEYDSAIPRREAPEVCVNFFRPSITEGAGNAGRSMHP